MQFTACYTKSKDESSYTAKILGWPGVITFGKDLEECRKMLMDAAQVTALCYRDEGREIPDTQVIVEPISIPLDDESLNAYEQMVEDMIARGEISRFNEDEEDEEAEALLAHVG